MRLHLASRAFIACSSVIVLSVTLSAELVTLDDRIAENRFRYLVTRSPTMKQMLDVIEQAADVSVTVRARHALHHWSEQSARGLLQVDSGRLRAVLEFDATHTKPSEQLEMVAHEVAHVVEAACLRRVATSGELRVLLLARGFGVRRRAAGHLGIETPFAIATGRLVLIEAMKRAAGPGQLSALAQQYSLGPPCAVTPNAVATR